MVIRKKEKRKYSANDNREKKLRSTVARQPRIFWLNKMIFSSETTERKERRLHMQQINRSLTERLMMQSKDGVAAMFVRSGRAVGTGGRHAVS